MSSISFLLSENKCTHCPVSIMNLCMRVTKYLCSAFEKWLDGISRVKCFSFWNRGFAVDRYSTTLSLATVDIKPWKWLHGKGKVPKLVLAEKVAPWWNDDFDDEIVTIELSEREANTFEFYPGGKCFKVCVSVKVEHLDGRVLFWHRYSMHALKGLLTSFACRRVFHFVRDYLQLRMFERRREGGAGSCACDRVHWSIKQNRQKVYWVSRKSVPANGCRDKAE